MQRPEFDIDGYSLIVRPEPVLFTPRTPQKKRGFFNSKLEFLCQLTKNLPLALL